MITVSKTIIVLMLAVAISFATELTLDFGTDTIDDRIVFELLSDTYTLFGSRTVREVKFLITDIGSDSPEIYFMNTANYPNHYYFYTDVLGNIMTLYDFNRYTYYPFNRRIIAGSILAHEEAYDDSTQGSFYTIEFWPIDLLTFEEVSLTWELLASTMFCSPQEILYHPSGQSQVNLYIQDSDLYQQSGIPVITTDSLYNNSEYIPLNTGEAYGILRGPVHSGVLSARDIPIFQSIPNTVSHVAGIITTTPQTPLSHVNLIARQNCIPNAYISSILLEDSSVAELVDSYVRFEVRPYCYVLQEISVHDFNSYYESIRPKVQTFPVRNLMISEIRNLDDVGFRDWTSIGAKAANVAELGNCLPSDAVPHGVAVPFYYYDEFLKANGLYDEIRNIMRIPEFNDDPLYRQSALAEFRSLIELSPFPDWMLDSLGWITERFEVGISLRCRSSTNMEDLPGFNGAGLYRSYTHHPHEGHIATTIRQVWASLWTYRAFEEREFHRIDHFHTAMGVLIHPSYQNEQANGVAVTQNVFDPTVPGYYVNAQIGEDLVTNPDEYSIPDEFVIIIKSPLGEDVCEAMYIAFSNRTLNGESVLSENHTRLLVEYLKQIQEHFSNYYIPNEEQGFAMEVEFKITSDGELVIKQGRPWIN